MRKRRFFALLALFGALTLVAAACGNDEDGGGGTTTGSETGATTGGAPVEKIDVTVYGQGAWTGPYNYLVVPSFQAAQLRFDELNNDPSFPATITLEQADTQGSGDNAPPVVQEVVSNPNTVAVIGPAFSGESEASGDTYEQAAIPFVTQSATNPGLNAHGWTYWYRAIGNDDDQGQPAAQYLSQVLGVGNVFVLHDKSTYGQGLAEVVRDTLDGLGVQVAGFEGVESGAEDFSAVISDVQSANPDAVYFGGYDADFGKILKQARDAGMDVPFMSGDGSVSSTTVDLAGDALTNTFLTCPCNLTGDFITKYNDAVGSDASSVPVYVGEGYDVASLIGEGIKAAIEGGATDPVAIRAGIKAYLDGLTPDAPFVGVSKSYAFDPATHELAAEDRASLIFFYEASPGAITVQGSASEVLGG